uniref:Uncharacterized protein n=1 Tax=Entomoneis paludosa TaxID=265537 RepID=A0A7S2Y8M0_9STRA
MQTRVFASQVGWFHEKRLLSTQWAPYPQCFPAVASCETIATSKVCTLHQRKSPQILLLLTKFPLELMKPPPNPIPACPQFIIYQSKQDSSQMRSVSNAR